MNTPNAWMNPWVAEWATVAVYGDVRALSTHASFEPLSIGRGDASVKLSLLFRTASQHMVPVTQTARHRNRAFIGSQPDTTHSIASAFLTESELGGITQNNIS
jgi:hypothetical protein